MGISGNTSNAMKRKILYINLDFPPIGGPAVWRAFWFTKYLTASGYHVTVLCSDRSCWCERRDETLLKHIPPEAKIIRLKSIFPNDLFVKAERLLSRTGSAPGKELLDVRPRDSRENGNPAAAACDRAGTDGHRGWGIYGWVKSLLGGKNRSRIRSWVDRYYPEKNLWWLLLACLKGGRPAVFEKFDCIITSGPPHISHVAGWLISTLSRTPWIMDYRDLWTDDPNQSPQSGYQANLFRFLEKKAVKNCDAVVTVSPSWTRHLAEKYGDVKHESKFHMIRNGHNIDEAPADFRKNANERLHIHFNGSPQGLSETTHLLDALFSLKSSGLYNGCLPLVTFTGITDSFRDQVRERGLEGLVKDVHSMTYQQSMDYSKAADVLLVIVNNNHPSMLGTIPAKTYEAIALGRHIFAMVPAGSDVVELLAEYGNATVCNVDNVEEIVKSLLGLIESSRELNGGLDVIKHREIAGKFSRKRLTDQLIGLIESLASDSREHNPATQHQLDG
jgi:glycosyltransferase involved in cell wall biosynthesis